FDGSSAFRSTGKILTGSAPGAGRLPFAGTDLMGSPQRMAAEQSAGKANLINQDHAEHQAEQPGRQSQSNGEVGVPLAQEVEGRSNAHGDQHHACNGSYAKHQQIG